ncbi:hypothetical protein NQZ68_022054 [Dissostichus eleginoides]|nr:hypothetical protein NQZ68_022054 [Dissostichus eleginoides]
MNTSDVDDFYSKSEPLTFSQPASSSAELQRRHTAAAMSRRRVSVRDLGLTDCQGWLLRRKEARSFLGARWKRYWFVLKKSSLYWYSNKMAEKAEGFIYLPGFTIQKAQQCKKKHSMTASHPLVVTIFIAAESFTDMNKWISKLSEAAEPSELIDTEECYSEGSDQDDNEECLSTSCSLTSVQEAAESDNGEDVPPPSEVLPPSPCREEEEGPLSRKGRRRVGGGRGGASVPLLHFPEEREEEEGGEAVTDPPPDEMELLYRRLQAARLSPIGQSSQKDFRASFIRRCPDDKINEELHLLRILSSTMKAKQSELQTLDQVLNDPALAAPTYRKWKLCNFLLLQEVAHHSRAAGGAAEPEDAFTTTTTTTT